MKAGLGPAECRSSRLLALFRDRDDELNSFLIELELAVTAELETRRRYCWGPQLKAESPPTLGLAAGRSC